MITVTVIEVAEAEGVRGRFKVKVKLSDGEHEETRVFVVFRYFLRETPFCGTVPAVGEVLTAPEFEALSFVADCTDATIRAVNLLAFGDNTAKKLKEKLQRKGISANAADAAVRFCIEKRYIREEEQLAHLMQNLCEKKQYGERRIKAEIYRKGFSEDAIKAVYFETLDTLDFDVALDKRIAKLNADAFAMPENRQKSIAALMRYGFSYEEIRRAMARRG